MKRILRPRTELSPAFNLAYARTGRGVRDGASRGSTGDMHGSAVSTSATTTSATTPPIVIIPGGPGLASILPHRSHRRIAAKRGLDVIMVEHRGVGFSRHDLAGRALPHDAMWVTHVVDDIAAVLDAEGIEQAIIAGSSYGSYLAATFGARHPERVAGMLLDSALQSSSDLDLERALIRELFWDVDTPTARAVREVAAAGEDERLLLGIVRAAYELGGDELLLPLLEQRLHTRISPSWLALENYAERGEQISRIPFYFEFDIAGAIGMRELNYAAKPDGLPLDPALTYADIADRFPSFAGEAYDLPNEVKRFEWPLVVLSGSRDVRTPPAIAKRVAGDAPGGILVEIENGHSALDTHPAAFLNAARELAAGRHERLPQLAAKLDQLPQRGVAARLPKLLRAGLAIEQGLSGNRRA